MKKSKIQQLVSNRTRKGNKWSRRRKKFIGLFLSCSLFTLMFDGAVYAAASEGNHIDALGESRVLSSEFDGDEELIPPDDRVRVKNTKNAPYRYVGKLQYKKNGDVRYATGALIGRRTVLTAAHCAYGTSGLSKNMRFYPAQDGTNNPYGSYEISEIYVPEEYKKAVDSNNKTEENKAQRQKYDYAVLTLKKSLPADYGYFRLGGDGTLLDRNGIKNQTIAIIGYPGERIGMYRHASKEHWFSKNSDFLSYEIDTTDGQSGSPVYRKKDGKYYIIAVHTRGDGTGNYGRYLDNTVRKYINTHKE